MEGRQAIRELLAVGRRPVKEIWLSEGLEPSVQLDEIEKLAMKRRVKVVPVSKRRIETTARTEAPQGVIAFAQPLEEVELEKLCVSKGSTPPRLLVLDGVTDPHNVGSLLRSAECAGVAGLVVARHRSAHVTPTVAKVAAGAIEHVPIAVVPGIPACLSKLHDLGVFTVGLEGSSATTIYDLPHEASGPVALVVGAEGRGLSDLARKRCSILASIPQMGRLPSLNVSVAGAVACFELARLRRTSQG